LLLICKSVPSPALLLGIIPFENVFVRLHVFVDANLPYLPSAYPRGINSVEIEGVKDVVGIELNIF
jgi:hypothetical protein